jgi:hypothetical protein
MEEGSRERRRMRKETRKGDRRGQLRLDGIELGNGKREGGEGRRVGFNEPLSTSSLLFDLIWSRKGFGDFERSGFG